MIGFFSNSTFLKNIHYMDAAQIILNDLVGQEFIRGMYSSTIYISEYSRPIS